MVSDPLPTTRSATVLLALLLLCFSVAAVGGVSTAEGVRDWYPALDKPPWTPPNWAFGPIWTLLYASMAVAAWDIIRRGSQPRRAALGWFGVQLALNMAWSPVFFGAQYVGLALLVMTALWVAVAACIAAFARHSVASSLLMVPYLGWLSIAWTLNAWILVYNP